MDRADFNLAAVCVKANVDLSLFVTQCVDQCKHVCAGLFRILEMKPFWLLINWDNEIKMRIVPIHLGDPLYEPIQLPMG